MNCCRTCMSTTSLNPIFQYIDKSNKYTDILAMTTGLKILINDSLPQVICTNCVNFINECQDFRETCQKSHRILTKCIKNDNLLDNDMSLKSEIDKQIAATVSAVKIEQTNDSDTNNDYFDSNNDHFDSNNDHFECGEKIRNLEDKKNIEFDMSIADLMKMKIGLTLPKSHKKDNLKSKDDKVVDRKNEVEKGDAEEWNKEARSTETEEISKEDESTDVEATSKVKESRDVGDSDAVEAINVVSKCKYCQKVFKKLQSFKQHLNTHTGRNTVCEHCGKKFLNKRRLLMHCKSKHGYEKTDKCSYCEFMGSNRYSVQIHERLHTGEKPYVCQKCGASFHRRSTYLQHIAIHLPEKTVQCDQCPARFKSTTLMRIHKNRHRAPQYTFRCRVCDNSYARRRDVVRHLQRIHGMQDTERDIERVKINRN